MDVKPILVPVFGPSKDQTMPFVCARCNQSFNDYPALIVVEIPGETLRYCSDDCAQDDGWTAAVAARWDQEVAGGGIFLLYSVPD